MKAKKKVSQKVYQKRIKACRRAPRKVTLTDVVKAAHTLGLEVSVKLVPNEITGSTTTTTPVVITPERPLLNWPTSQWPGDPTNRHIIAAMDYTKRDVERGFKDNPTAKWIITPYEIIPRETFFNPPPPPVLPAVAADEPAKTTSTSQPTEQS